MALIIMSILIEHIYAFITYNTVTTKKKIKNLKINDDSKTGNVLR